MSWYWRGSMSHRGDHKRALRARQTSKRPQLQRKKRRKKTPLIDLLASNFALLLGCRGRYVLHRTVHFADSSFLIRSFAIHFCVVVALFICNNLYEQIHANAHSIHWINSGCCTLVSRKCSAHFFGGRWNHGTQHIRSIDEHQHRRRAQLGSVSIFIYARARMFAADRLEIIARQRGRRQPERMTK